MASTSAGILLYKRQDKSKTSGLSVFLVHPGGPFWAKKDAGAWSIPKGEFAPGENPLAAAQREFLEETGQAVAGDFVALQSCRLASGKTVHAWAVEGDIDADAITSNEFEMIWPPRSGRVKRFPEVDRAAWFPLAEARHRINKGQVPLLDALARLTAQV
jgi:predicted NUDIX family NTP pyrophosphohydrolase